jgi:hypothetical protein
MKNRSITRMAFTLALCLSLISCGRPHETVSASPKSSAASSTPPMDSQAQVQPVVKQVRPEVEKQRQEAQQQAEKTLDKEAAAAIEETQNAIKAIAANNITEARAAIERATGKIETLLARNTSTALIPVTYEVEVIDAIGLDLPTIRERSRLVAQAVHDKDYPAARALLYGLTSEIHVRTYTLPLATYPAALKEAARLLDMKQNKEANAVLLTALNTLVAIDRVTPIPLILAVAAVEAAQVLGDKDRQGALKLLDLARNELQMAKELGYSGNDPEYAAMDKDITNLETQLKGTGNTTSPFASLKERVSAFFNRQTQSERHGG